MRSIVHFVGYNLKKLFTSPKPYITFLLIFAVLRIGVGGVNTYLEAHGQAIQAVELFIFTHSSVFFQLVFILGLLLLLGDSPFLREGMSFRLMRTSRNKWLAGQMISCAVISAIYLVVIELLFLILFFGHISFQNEWSDPIRLASQVNTGGMVINIKAAVFFTMSMLQTGSPYAVFRLTFLYNLLLYSYLSLVIISCNLKFNAGIGYFGVITFLGIKLVQRYILPYKPLWYLSPCSVVCLAERSITMMGIVYTIMYLTSLCCCLVFLAFRFVRHSDLLRGDYA